MPAIASEYRAGAQNTAIWILLCAGQKAEGLQTDRTGLNSQAEDFCLSVQEIS
jgi:hypothetical protein